MDYPKIGGAVGGNIPVYGPAGIAVSVFGGLAYDGSHWAFYYGDGLGAGVGAGVSGGLTLGGSNAHSVCGLSGLFVNVGGSGAAGLGGGGELFVGKDNQGNTVTGAM